MTIPFIDIHTHHPKFTEGIISVQSLFLQDLEFNKILTNPFSAGIHPWHANRINSDEIKTRLNRVINQPGLIAIGETGLDKKCHVDFNLQKTVFELHIEIAEKFRKPLIIHCVNAWDEMIATAKRSNVPIILHGFSGNRELTIQLIRHGFSFSIGKAILKENSKLKESIQIIPSESLFFETDDEILDIREVYDAASSILKCSAEDLKHQIIANYNRVFQII
jgi:TatD DNase family protein